MVKSIKFLVHNKSVACAYNDMNTYKLVIEKDVSTTDPFTFEIEFIQNISAFRNHDYLWTDIKQRRIGKLVCTKDFKA